MQKGTKNNLSVAEISGIWSSYFYINMNISVYDYCLAKVKDEEIRTLLEYVKNIYLQRSRKLEDVFTKEGLVKPHGFNIEDVNINAPSLFMDGFYLWYLYIMVYFEMTVYTFILNNITDTDLLNFFSKSITESIEIYNKNTDLLTAKSLYIDAPKVEILKEVTYVKDKSFLGSWFGNQRSMLASESTMIYTEILYNTISRAIFSGFGQVSTLKEVRDFMFKGRDIATKQIKSVSKISNKENLPVPSSSDAFITDSATAPFSNKLMMNISLVLAEILLINGDVGIIGCFRKDIQRDNIKNVTEYGKFALDGAHIMIDNGWLEQPPVILKGEDLARN